MPRIFISYAHESDSLKRVVREFILELRRRGIDARLDQLEITMPHGGWPVWSSRQIVAADYVLLLCTEAYFDRFAGLAPAGSGLGVRYESSVIQNVQYFGKHRTLFLPLLPDATQTQLIPPAVSPAEILTFTGDPQKDCDVVIRRLALPVGPGLEEAPHAKRCWERSSSADVPALAPDASVITQAATDQIAGALRHINSKLDDIRSHQQRKSDPPLMPPRSTKIENADFVGIDELRYHQQWLEFRRPQHLWQSMREFTFSDDLFRWTAIVGDGGTGKSRFAFEWMQSLQAGGWKTGFLRSNSGSAWLKNFAHFWRPDRPCFITIDYATGFSPVLASGLASLEMGLRQAEDADQPPVRILLLDRPGFRNSVAMELVPSQHGGATDRDIARVCLWKAPASSASAIDDNASPRPAETTKSSLFELDEAFKMDRVPREYWADVLRHVVNSVSGKAVENEVSKTWGNHPDDSPTWQRIARLTDDGRYLFLQILGICFARQTGLQDRLTDGDGLERLLDEMLGYEMEHRWVDFLPDHVGESIEAKLGSRSFEAVRRGVAFVTLCRGLDLNKHKEQLRQIIGGDPQAANAIAKILRTEEADQVGTAKHLLPLEPDLLGERLLLAVGEPGFEAPCDLLGLTATNSAIDLRAWLRIAVAIDAEGLFETLMLATADFPKQTLLWSKTLFEVANEESLLENPGFVRSLQTLFINESTIRHVDRNKIEAELTQFADLAERDLLSWVSYFLNAAINLSALIDRAWGPEESALYGQWSTLALYSERIASVAIDVINHYGAAHRFDDLERWGQQLVAVAKEHPKSEEIQLMLAVGAASAIKYYGTANHFHDLERWGQRLIAVAKYQPQSNEVQLQMAKGAFSAIIDYSTANRFDDMERWAQWLVAVAREHPEWEEIQHGLARGSFNALNRFGIAHRLDDLERWGRQLDAVAQKHPESDKIQLELAHGALNALVYYGVANRFDDLERWGRILRRVVGANSSDPSFLIPLVLALIYGGAKLPDRDTSEFLILGRDGLQAGLADFSACDGFAKEFLQWLPRSGMDAEEVAASKRLFAFLHGQLENECLAAILQRLDEFDPE